MNNLYRLVYCLLFIVFISSCDNTSDFDLVCSYFDSLQNEGVNDRASSDEKFKYINDLIVKNLTADSPARISFNAVVGYVPVDGRYALYVDAAESTLNKSWKCQSMNGMLEKF